MAPSFYDRGIKMIIEETRPLTKCTVTEEMVNGKTVKNYFITGSFLKANTRNQNGNFYPLDVVKEAVKEYNDRMISTRRALGELNHPHKQDIDFDRVSHLTESLVMQGEDAIGKARILDTTAGRTVKALIDANVNFGVSIRALGATNDDKIMQPGLSLVAVDIVADPSFVTSFVTPILESKQDILNATIIEEATGTSVDQIEDAFRLSNKLTFEAYEKEYKTIKSDPVKAYAALYDLINNLY